MGELAWIKAPGPPGRLLAQSGERWTGGKGEDAFHLAGPVADLTWTLDDEDVVLSSLTRVNALTGAEWGQVRTVARLHGPLLLDGLREAWSGRHRYAKAQVPGLRTLAIVDCPPDGHEACVISFLDLQGGGTRGGSCELEPAVLAQLIGTLADLLDVDLDPGELTGL